uniref:Uncharacterized protein n=1 Tax=Physcomitrium patens TaxID=3218 RepID=A0A7I4BSI2_PHYPA
MSDPTSGWHCGMVQYIICPRRYTSELKRGEGWPARPDPVTKYWCKPSITCRWVQLFRQKRGNSGQKTQKTNGLDSSGPAGLASKIHEESTSKEVEFTAEQLSSSEDFRTYRPRLRSERERLLLASTRAKKARVKKRLPPKAAPPPPKNSRRIVAIPPPPPPPKNIGRGRCSPSPPPPPPTPMASYSLGKRNH